VHRCADGSGQTGIMKAYLRYLKLQGKYFVRFVRGFLIWIAMAAVIGAAGGLIGTAFRLSVAASNQFWLAHRWMIWLLPASGLLIVFLYHVCGFASPLGTNRIIRAVRREEEVPWRTAPLIFACSILTHICGGSAGREGAALQIGGTIGYRLGKLAHLSDEAVSLAVLAGMSALFAALFGCPIAAMIFAMEVISVGIFHYAGLVPCLISALIGYKISDFIGGGFVFKHNIALPTFDIALLLKVLVIGLISAAVSILLVVAMDYVRRGFARLIGNPYLKIVVGAGILIGLTYLFPGGDYNGAGDALLLRALDGQAVWWSFLVKLLFTAITLGVGFKGGEIMPVFVIGAAVGCAAAPLLQMDPGTVAAMAMIGTFCGAVNCPLASIVMGVEFFGSSGLPYYAVVCCVSYLMSGYFGLYGSQKIVYSKLRAEFIDRHSKT
jgi:H+/Cl- antiporter ClcA